MKNRWKRVIINILQITISIVAALFVVYKLIQFKEWDTFYIYWKTHKTTFPLLIIIQLLLSFISLSLEAIKWQKLLEIIHQLNFKEAFYQILKGLQAGMVTPSRLGDPPTRILHLPKDKRSHALLFSMMGIMMQNLIIGIGAITSLLLVGKVTMIDTISLGKIETEVLRYMGYLLLLIATGQILLFIASKFLYKYHFIRKVTSFFLIIKKFNVQQLASIIILTILKYATFCFQLWLALYYFHVTTSPSHILLVAIYFGIITILPSFAIADLGLRGSVAILIFGLISTNSIAIVLSIFILWCINLAAPALVPLLWRKRSAK